MYLSAYISAYISPQGSVFVGQGAGRFPTANSCVSDILEIAQAPPRYSPRYSPRSPPRSSPRDHRHEIFAEIIATRYHRDHRHEIYARLREIGRLGYAQGSGGAAPFPKVAPKALQYTNSYTSAFYVRLRFRDQTGISRGHVSHWSQCCRCSGSIPY